MRHFLHTLLLHTRVVHHILLPASCAASLVLLLAASCDRRDIYREGVTTRPAIVSMDWRNLGSDPTGASIYMYPESGTTPYVFKTNSVGKATVQVPSGYYTVLVFNRTVDEFGTMHFQDMSQLGYAKALLDSRYVAWVGTADSVGRTVYDPEIIVVGRTDHFCVHEVTSSTIELYESTRANDADGSSTSQKQDTCYVTPQQVVMTGTIRVRVVGIQNVSSVRGYLTGLSGGLFLGTRSTTDTLATHIVENWTLQRDEGDYTKGYLVGTFQCFGLPEQFLANKSKLNNHLTLQLRLVDNKTIITTGFDVGDRIEEIASELKVYLVVGVQATTDDDPIVVPDVEPEDGSKSGFDVSLDDWEDPEDVVIPL